MLIPTGPASALRPSPTEATLAVDAAANAEGAALADGTMAGAAADAVPAEGTRAGEAANTDTAEVPTAAAGPHDVPAKFTKAAAATAAAATAADAEPADVITTRVAAHTGTVINADMTIAGAAAADTADAVLADNTRAAAADTATIEVATAGGGVAGKMNILSQVADQAAGDAGEAAKDAVAPKAHMGNTHGCCKPVSTADELHKGSVAAFIAAAAFSGAKGGMLFKSGDQGLGYYADTGGLVPAVTVVEPLERASPIAAESRRTATSLAAKKLKEHCMHAHVDPRLASSSAMMPPTSTASFVDNVSTDLSSHAPRVKEVLHGAMAMYTGQKQGEDLGGNSEGRCKAGLDLQVKGEGVAGKADEGDKTGHYWGQALQYLDRSVQVCHSL